MYQHIRYLVFNDSFSMIFWEVNPILDLRALLLNLSYVVDPFVVFQLTITCI